MPSTKYTINTDVQFGFLSLIDVDKIRNSVREQWFNQTLCRVNDCVVRLGVMQGEFHWHKHDEQDEFFFVLDGLLRIEIDGAETVELSPRQAFSVPAGMLHRPVAPVRSAVLMIEKAGVTATGD